VKVKGFGDMQRFLKEKTSAELKNGAKVSDLLLFLGGRVGVSGVILLGSFRAEDSSLVIILNGRNIHAIQGYETVLKDGDLVSFVPVLVGG